MLDPYFDTLWYYWTNVIIYHLSALILTIIFIIHSKKIYSDLFTKSRHSVSHRSKLPHMDFNYKAITILTHLSIISYVISTISGALAEWTIITQSINCLFIVKFSSIFYLIAKSSMYCVFLYRLHMVYCNSAYSYNPKIITIFGIINLIYCITMIILFIWSTKVSPNGFSFGKYAIFCNPSYPEFLPLVLGGFDLFMSILCLIAFIYPLRKIAATTAKSKSSVLQYSQSPDHGKPGALVPDQSAMTKQQKNEIKRSYKTDQGLTRLKAMGIKSSILTLTAVLSTVLILITVVILNSAMIIPIDAIINVICICLMTPYYRNETFYDRLCCLCIRCCMMEKQRDFPTPTMMDNTTVSDEKDDGDGKVESGDTKTQTIEIEVEKQTSSTL